MIMILFLILGVVTSALLNRVRGGWTGNLPFGATVARFVWAFGCAAVINAQAAHVGIWGWWMLAIPVLLWLGTVMGWQGSLDLGRNEDSWFRDFAVMTARGLLWTAPTAAAVFWFWGIWAALPLIVAGLLCAALYELAWYAPKSWSLPFARGPEMGEVLFGAAVGFGLTLAPTLASMHA